MEVLLHMEESLRTKYAFSFVFAGQKKVKFKQECALDEVYTHFKSLRKDMVLSVDENPTENTTFFMTLCNVGFKEHLDEHSIHTLSYTCKSLYRYLDSRKVMFPQIEDIPRYTRKIAVDIYYISVHTDLHRVSLVRYFWHQPNLFACFVDGELVILHRKQYKPMYFNYEVWKSGHKSHPHRYHFHISGVRFTVVPDGETSTMYKTFSSHTSYYPHNFAIYQGTKLISTSKTKNRCTAISNFLTFPMWIFLFPVFFLYKFMLLFCCCWFYCRTQLCITRKYFVSSSMHRKKIKKLMVQKDTKNHVVDIEETGKQ